MRMKKNFVFLGIVFLIPVLCIFMAKDQTILHGAPENYHMQVETDSKEQNLTLQLTIDQPEEEVLIKADGLEMDSESARGIEMTYPEIEQAAVDGEKGELRLTPKKSNEPLQLQISFKKKAVSEKAQGSIQLLANNQLIQTETFDKYVEEPTTYAAMAARSLTEEDVQALPDGATTVDNWADFTAALQDSTTTTIYLTNDIANPNTARLSTPLAGTLSKSVSIEGIEEITNADDPIVPKQRVIDFGDTKAATGACGIKLDDRVADSQILNVKDIEFKGRGTYTSSTNALIYSTDKNSNWSVNFENFSYSNGSTKRILAASTAFVTMKGDNEISIEAGSDSADSNYWHRAFECRSFILTNGASLKSDTRDMLFYSNFSGSQRGNGSRFIVEEGSELEASNKNTPIIGTKGDYFDFYIGADDSGLSSTVKLSTETKTMSSYAGAVCGVGNSAHYLVDNHSSLDITNTLGSAISMASTNGVFDVDNESTFNATSNSDSGDKFRTTVFFVKPGAFKISNKSEVNILKKNEGNVKNNGSALRMMKGNNHIIVSGGSKVSIDSSSSNDLYGYAVLLGDSLVTVRNGIHLRDSNSTLQIQSRNSGGLAFNSPLDLEGGPGTVLQVSSNGATFNTFYCPTANSTFEFDQMRDYDIRNNAKEKIFNCPASNIRFVNSNISVWKKATDLDGDPYKTFNNGNAGFAKNAVAPTFSMDLIPGIEGNTYTTTPEIGTFFGANPISTMARISGDSSLPIVDQLRTPTNADKYIVGRVVVPDAGADTREALTDEVTVKVKVTKANGDPTYELTGQTVGSKDATDPGLSIYGEKARPGLFKIENKVNGKTEYLEAGDKVEVVEAWWSSDGSDSNQDKIGVPSDDPSWVQTPKTTIDVTPPKQAMITTKKITNSTKQLAGTAEEDGAKVFVKAAGQWLKDANGNPTTTTVKNNKWQIDLPGYLTKDTQLEVYLKDNTDLGNKADFKEFQLPETYTDAPDGSNGNMNIEPAVYNTTNDGTYHDVTADGTEDNRFNPATSDQVLDVLPDAPEVSMYYVSNKVQVKKPIRYIIEVRNTKDSSLDTLWKDVTVTDVLPKEVDFNLSDAEIEIDEMPADAKNFTYDEDTCTLSINLGDIASGYVKKISFEAKFNEQALDKVVTNTATATGYSPQESNFVPGPEDESHPKAEISQKYSISTEGEVDGSLELISAPENIEFGQIIYDGRDKNLNNPTWDRSLQVSDTRKYKTPWKLNATMVQLLQHETDKSVVLPEALSYKHGSTEVALTSEAQPVYTSTSGGSADISGGWSDTGDGIKMKVKFADILKTGNYSGEILWSLETTP